MGGEGNCDQYVFLEVAELSTGGSVSHALS